MYTYVGKLISLNREYENRLDRGKDSCTGCWGPTHKVALMHHIVEEANNKTCNHSTSSDQVHGIAYLSIVEHLLNTNSRYEDSYHCHIHLSNSFSTCQILLISI